MLRRAVDSCRESAAGRLDIEVIVAIDGAYPLYATSLASEDSRVVLLRGTEPRGRGHARNRGLEAAKGRYVKFLDDDDWLEPGGLAAEVECADECEADIVASGYREAGPGTPSEVHWPPPFRDGIDSLLRGESVPTGAALYRREGLSRVRWTERPCKLDDWHFFLCAGLQARRIEPLREIAYTWHMHSGQVVRSASRNQHVTDFYWVLGELEERLRTMALLTDPRRARLAQYRYKELSALCELDRDRFEAEAHRILALDPGFRPRDEERRAWMRWLARLVGFRRAVRLLTRAKLILGRA